jgi:carbon storage regulator
VLIITRREGEKIVLGGDITIEVMEIAGNTVRLGVEAPRELPVYREEIWAAVKDENQAAAGAAGDQIPDESVRLEEENDRPCPSGSTAT